MHKFPTMRILSVLWLLAAAASAVFGGDDAEAAKLYE